MNIFELFGTISLKGAEAAEKQLQGLEGWAKKNEKALKAMGAVMTAGGVAITGALALATKAALDEDINIQHLSISLKNVGTNYDSVKESLEGVITATQRKTGIADSEQRDILSRLLLVTKDYNKALKLLPLSLDLAAAGQMDANTAATYLGKAMLELENGAKSVSIRLGQATVQFKSLAEIQDRVGGSAEAMANPLKILTAEIGDLAEEIGKTFLPMLRETVSRIVTTVGAVKDWINENPEAARTITLVAGATGLLLSVVGPLALLLPKLPIMLATVRTALHLLLGPIGWVTLAITALAAVALIIADNWESIVDPVGVSVRKITATIKAELEKQKQDELNAITARKTAIQTEYDARIAAIHKEYGDLKNAAITKQQLAKDSSEVSQRILQDELKNSQRIHDRNIAMLQEEYAEKIRLLNAGADARIKDIQKQIDAIDKRTETEDRSIRDIKDAERKAELERAITLAKAKGTQEEYVAARKELADFLADVERRHLLDQRQDEKDSLRTSIDEIRNTAKTKEDILNEELKALTIAEDAKMAKVIEDTGKLETYLNGLFLNELYRIDTEGIAKIKMAEDSLKATVDNLEKEEKALNESYQRRINQAAEYARLRAIAEAGGTSTGPGGTTIPQPAPPIVPIVPFMARGGMITEPSLITRLRDRRPIAIAGEAGPEPVGFAGVTVTGNVFNVRKESDIDRIAEAIVGKIRLQQGLRGI